MKFFWTLWGIDACIALIFIYFFLIGLTDGSVSAFNFLLWLFLLGGLAIILGGSWWLKDHRQLSLAKVLLLVLAVPGVLGALFFLILIVSNPRWN